MVQQDLVNAGVRLVDVDVAGGHAAVKDPFQPAAHQQGQDVLRDVAQIIGAVAVVFQPADQLHHPAADPEDAGPVFQHFLHLEGAALLLGGGHHGLVALVAGAEAGVQFLPGLAAKGQPVDLVLDGGVAEPVQQKIFGGKIDHHPAEIENDIFIHRRFSLRYTFFSVLHSIAHRDR